MRVRILWHIIKIGNMIASPEIVEQKYDNGYVRGTITYPWWYRPIVTFGFWLCRDGTI
jgi:hypothetical protein